MILCFNTVFQNGNRCCLASVQIQSSNTTHYLTSQYYRTCCLYTRWGGSPLLRFQMKWHLASNALFLSLHDFLGDLMLRGMIWLTGGTRTSVDDNQSAQQRIPARLCASHNACLRLCIGQACHVMGVSHIPENCQCPHAM